MDLYSAGRPGLGRRDRFTAIQLEHIRRTARRTPEVMVKVTGGGRTIKGVAATLAYISHDGEAPFEDDRGRSIEKSEQKALLKEWHLELSSGQYRPIRTAEGRARRIKLVHNVVLSMPSPTPAKAVLAAARHFAREKFGAQHHYVMALHTHQQHPHVHLVIKAEPEDGRKRLRIDKAMLREWREDFAQAMRAQGIAANATPRAWRGQSKRSTLDRAFWAERNGRSSVVAAHMRGILPEIKSTGTFQDPGRAKLIESRKTVVAGWESIARALDSHGEIELAGDVRYFLSQMPRVLTNRERLAADFITYVNRERSRKRATAERVRDRAQEHTR